MMHTRMAPFSRELAEIDDLKRGVAWFGLAPEGAAEGRPNETPNVEDMSAERERLGTRWLKGHLLDQTELPRERWRTRQRGSEKRQNAAPVCVLLCPFAMRAFSRLGLGLSALLVAFASSACWDEDGSGAPYAPTNPYETGGGGGGSPGGPLADLSGSYLLRAVNVHDNPGVPILKPESLLPVRLDLRRDATGKYEAVVGVANHSPASFAVEETARGLRLEGDALAEETPPDSEIVRRTRWHALSLTRGADGGLADAAMTVIEEWVTDGGDRSPTERASEVDGRVERDTTSPLWSAPPRYRKGPAEAIFPWESLRMALSEGVAARDLPGALSVSPEGAPGVSLGMIWQAETGTDPAAEWAGSIGAFTMPFADWDAIAGRSLVVDARPVSDLSGNVSSPLTARQAVAAVALKDSPLTFDAPESGVFTWGDAKLTAAGDACENGGCLAFGPFERHWCPLPYAGAAGRLHVEPGASKLVLRYRIEYEQLPSIDFYYPSAFTVRLATPGGQRSSATRALVKADSLGPWPGSALNSTPWLTFEVPLPALGPGDGAEIGVSIDAGGDSLVPDCIFNGEPSRKLGVFVDDVRVE